MQKNKWSRKFEWIKSGSTYIQHIRPEIYDQSKYIAVGDIYFKLNKYLTGVTFNYINSLNDVYKKDLVTGDGYSIVNMYNEYDVIDRVMKNIVFVDAASDIDIQLLSGKTRTQWKTINNVKLKPDHLVLLKNQISEFENDVYKISNQYFLDNAGFLSSRDKSDKFSCSVKMGNNADKQFFLLNNGYEFPITNEPKYFIEGQSFILKNLIQYNLYNTSTGSTSKIIFTDFDFARKQIVDNYNLYYEAYLDYLNPNSVILPSKYVTINYHHDSYTIRSGVTTDYDGLTSGMTNNAYSGGTYIPFPSGYNCAIGDYIHINIYSGITSLLELNTFIKNIENNYIIIEESIPNRILNELKIYPFFVENLTVATNWWDAIDKLTNFTPYVDYYSITTGITSVPDYIILRINTKEFIYNKYFDYDGLIFNFIDDTTPVTFNTNYHYIKYKLFDRLYEIDNTIFTSGFTFFNDIILSGSSIQDSFFTDSNRIKITLRDKITNLFKPYTYVNISGEDLSVDPGHPLPTPTQKALVYSVSDYEIIIDKPLGWSLTTIGNLGNIKVRSIQNIDGLKNISDILYEVYMNQEYKNGWYVQKKDNERKYIARSYGELLTYNELFRKNVTGILYENQNNEFVLKLYDLGRNLTPSGDTNLTTYNAIELVYIGSDKKTRLPVPLKMMNENSGSTYSLYWNCLDDGFDDASNISPEIFDAGENIVLPGINNPQPIYNIIDGNACDFASTTTTTTTLSPTTSTTTNCVVDFNTYTCVVDFNTYTCLVDFDII